MLFKIVQHILYIQLIFIEKAILRNTVGLIGDVNMSKVYLKKKKKSIINWEKEIYGSCFPSITHNSPQDLRLFSTLRNEVTACRFLFFRIQNKRFLLRVNWCWMFRSHFHFFVHEGFCGLRYQKTQKTIGTFESAARVMIRLTYRKHV